MHGKQLTYNTQKGKLQCTLLIVAKLELLVCLTENFEQKFSWRGKNHKFPVWWKF